MKCRIKWIDAEGNPTPDENEAIAECWMESYVYRRDDGTTFTIEESAHFPVCEEHLERLKSMIAEGRSNIGLWRYTLYVREEYEGNISGTLVP